MPSDYDATYDTMLPRYPELRGKVALITGSGRGIGRVTAMRLAREGMRIAVNDLTQESADDTAAMLRAHGAEAAALAADMGDPDAAAALVRRAAEALGGLDLFVNNAADQYRSAFADNERARVDRSLDVNVRGPYHASLEAVRLLRERGGGSVIHLSSIRGERAHSRGLPYGLVKSALDALTRGMAVDCAAYGIRVNAVAPGATMPILPRPDVLAKHPKFAQMAARVPMGRLASALEIAAAIAFLASDEAAYITGHVLYVDGGVTAQLTPAESPI
jgi:3-oxoacyl-[acyl-carrier protein] reductase